MAEDDVIEIQGEKIKYVLRKPRVGDWKEYYKRRKEFRSEYDDVQGENFALSLFMIERCLIEPKGMSVEDIPFADFSLLSEALLQASIPHPLRKKSSPMT